MNDFEIMVLRYIYTNKIMLNLCVVEGTQGSDPYLHLANEAGV